MVKQIFNSDHKLYTLHKYVICKSRVEIDHKFIEISLNITILEIFCQCKCYTILFTFSSKNAFSPILVPYRLKDAKCNTLDLADYQNEVRNYRMFLRE